MHSMCCVAFPQTLVSRETSPLGSSVVSVTRLAAGDAFNVIPDTVKLGGTVRCTSDENMQVRAGGRAAYPALLLCRKCLLQLVCQQGTPP